MLCHGSPRVSAGACSLCGTTFLDRASVRGLALLLPQDGIRGFGRPISLRVIHSGERSQGAVGLVDPVVQVAFGGVEGGAGAGYAVANSGLSTPVLNPLPETHMRCMITASLRATATRARLAPRRRATATPQARSLKVGGERVISAEAAS